MGKYLVLDATWRVPGRVGLYLTQRALVTGFLSLLALVPLTACGGDPAPRAGAEITPSTESARSIAEAEEAVWLSTLRGDGLGAKSDLAAQPDPIGANTGQKSFSNTLASAGVAPADPVAPAITPAMTTVISTDYHPQHAAAAAAAVTARLPPAFSEPAHGTIILALEPREPAILQLGLRPIFSLQSPGEPSYQTVIIHGPPDAAADTGDVLSATAQDQTETTLKTAPADGPSAGYRLQLASLKNRGGAEREAARLFAAFEDLFVDRPLSLVAADLGDRGLFHRIQFSGYPSFGTATATCSVLKARGQDCLVLKPL